MPDEPLLPAPRQDDDEDVVWGISTATALWGRGERADALVWLRRASEAATAAGQEFRASELSMYAVALEEAMRSAPADGAPAPAPATSPPPAPAAKSAPPSAI